MTHKRLTLATLLLGAVAAGLAARSAPGFRAVLAPVQLTMSVLVPFFGVLAMTGPSRPGADHRRATRLLAALALAAGFALAGSLLAALATALTGGAWPPAPRTAWLVLAAVLVQLIAQLVGTACGLLSRRPLVAMAATIVIPMTVTAVLTVIAPGGAVRWLTPFGNARSLLTDAPTGTTFAALGVVVLLWCVLPNAALLAIHQRRETGRPVPGAARSDPGSANS
ncbi:hypothetical protein [Actinoplanes regularis]|uniref:Uncharacterized protein n=1 Tax=Actinoplanes regularis TaxID=52697 RepID=A0A239CRK9_9ACTN|nr:hypothetical protein [Actinoplanes regularis]GIE88644.1 hypothetical protein Are01nite_51240 [Actinoplanes regularis]SNS22023.1 hypothetical protein SAMN06264365_11222 [Actinoplanes regularis]